MAGRRRIDPLPAGVFRLPGPIRTDYGRNGEGGRFSRHSAGDHRFTSDHRSLGTRRRARTTAGAGTHARAARATRTHVVLVLLLLVLWLWIHDYRKQRGYPSESRRRRPRGGRSAAGVRRGSGGSQCRPAAPTELRSSAGAKNKHSVNLLTNHSDKPDSAAPWCRLIKRQFGTDF